MSVDAAGAVTHHVGCVPGEAAGTGADRSAPEMQERTHAHATVQVGIPAADGAQTALCSRIAVTPLKCQGLPCQI